MILISFVFQKLWDCEQTKFRPDQSSFASPIEVWFQTSCSHPSRFHPAVVSYLLSWFFSWEAPPPRLYSWIPIFYHDFLWGVISSRLSPHGFMLCGFPSPPHDILLMRDDRHLHGFFFISLMAIMRISFVTQNSHFGSLWLSCQRPSSPQMRREIWNIDIGSSIGPGCSSRNYFVIDPNYF